ncbi:MAG TPA: MurR/RpiR family transcriptional regulator, partial [Solirubrobacteraceae bacterium]|nr:MurR/RpiR family transcriptional regulator [Solirubrobacteraceae bacterium]
MPVSDPTRPEHHQSLSKYIQSRFDECSRSQKDVAQYIVDHLDEAAFQTAEELARRANTSSSTVVRFSQALGFEGFPELQAAAREEYRRAHASPVQGAISPGTTPLFAIDQNEFEDALAADHVNVEDTARKLSRSAVEEAIDAISEAEKVLIAGTDQMAFFASYLRHLLMLLDLRADIVASPSQEALSRLGRIDEATLLIGLSAGRPHPLVV